MNWLTFYFLMQLGVASHGLAIDPMVPGMPVYAWSTPANTVELSLEPRFVFFDHLELGGSIRSYQYPTGNGLEFNPVEINYEVHAKIFAGPFSVTASHYCDHSLRLSATDVAQPATAGFTVAETSVTFQFQAKVQF